MTEVTREQIIADLEDAIEKIRTEKRVIVGDDPGPTIESVILEEIERVRKGVVS